MLGPALSAETQRRLNLVFAPAPGQPDLRDEVGRLLTEQCGNNLPFCERNDQFQMERIRFAVLKLSQGSMSELLRAIGVAKVDWRDVLVAAGFGNELLAHRRWLAQSEITESE
jgi:hypothetical protein